jgi:hypothetical protein
MEISKNLALSEISIKIPAWDSPACIAPACAKEDLIKRLNNILSRLAYQNLMISFSIARGYLGSGVLRQRGKGQG